jgi:hypothetical protein
VEQEPKHNPKSPLSNLKSWLPAVHPQVGAAIYRGEAVELEQRLPHLGREPHQARQNVHRLALGETPEVEVTKIILAKLSTIKQRQNVYRLALGETPEMEVTKIILAKLSTIKQRQNVHRLALGETPEVEVTEIFLVKVSETLSAVESQMWVSFQAIYC